MISPTVSAVKVERRFQLTKFLRLKLKFFMLNRERLVFLLNIEEFFTKDNLVRAEPYFVEVA